MSFSDEQEKRIVIAGLPEAGLRTIKAIVVDNAPPSEVKDHIEKLEVGKTFHDLLQMRVLLVRCGGEQSIQDILDSDSDPIYKNVESLIFVVDVAEQSNFSVAKYWFDKLVHHLHKFSPEARVFVFLHKTDLLSEKTDPGGYLRATKELFNADGIDIYFHETSIYDASLFYAFQDVLRKEDEDQISVNQYLSRMLKETSFTGLAVYSQDGLPIYEMGNLPTLIQVSANVILGSLEKITTELEKGDEITSTILQMKESFLLFKRVNPSCVFIGLTEKRPKFGQVLVETDQIVGVLKKAI